MCVDLGLPTVYTYRVLIEIKVVCIAFVTVSKGSQYKRQVEMHKPILALKTVM